jgi:hypothetical protein
MKNPEIKTVSEATGADVFHSIENFLEKNRNIFLGICLAITVLLCYLLFDARMSFATDDSEYVKMAYNFLFQGTYPTYHGTLYPLMLALLYKIFGLKVVVFKLFSSFFMLASVFLFYKAFRGKVPYLVLFTVLIYLSVNSYFLYFASQTFSEAFVLMLQALSFLFFLNLIRQIEINASIRKTWKLWLMFGFLMLVLTITKNILIVGIGSAVLYFLIYKEWKNAALAVISFLVFKLPYELYTRTVLHVKTTSQLDQIMQKNFYNPAEGNEDFPSGYIDRFFTNFNNFISVQVYKILGLRPEHMQAKTDDEANVLLSLLFAAFIVFVFITIYRKSRYLMFALLYAVGVLFVSFAAVQTIWSDQWRLALPYIPYLLIAFTGALWIRAKEAKQAVFKTLLIFALVLFIIIQLPLTADKVSANSRGLKYYIKGDMTYGIPDPKKNIGDQWLPFVQICDSISSKVPPGGRVATGKPGEAFVYSRFPNVERISSPAEGESADTVLAHLKKQGITHLFIDGSGAVMKAVQIIEKKYPQKLVPVLQAGPDQEHSFYLIEVKY